MRVLKLVSCVLFIGIAGCVTVSNNASNVIPVTSLNMMQLQKAKKGEACRKNILFGIWWGNDNITDAAQNGGITRVAFVERKIESYFLFNKFCTVVYGAQSNERRKPEGKQAG